LEIFRLINGSGCRYGVGDSVGLAVQLEKRYRGVRSPHKFKGGVSGCVRECAEAQGKDFGVIATDKGWNSSSLFAVRHSLCANRRVVFVGGNGGASPVSIFTWISLDLAEFNGFVKRHAELLAKDIPPSKVTRIIDRFLAYYIMTADKLQRTARWIENMDGGIEVRRYCSLCPTEFLTPITQKLRKVILEDKLGICAELDAIMDNIVNTYEDEWANVVKGSFQRTHVYSTCLIFLVADPIKRQQFKQFVNTSERREQSELIEERGQKRPADWPRASVPLKFTSDQLSTPKSQWSWVAVAKVEDMVLTSKGTTSVAVKYGDTQLALYHVPKRGFYATQQMCA
jgi:nitrite reductase (NAD(P)H)